MYQSGKTYGAENGFSCAFRQAKAKSHCSRLHGYPLSFRFVFESNQLDENGWIIDFGALKPIKEWLQDHFDHKTLIAADDPELEYFKDGEERGVLDLVIMPKGVGCENFARFVAAKIEVWLQENGYSPRVNWVSVTVAEHGANHATYINPTLDIENKQNKTRSPILGFIAGDYDK